MAIADLTIAHYISQRSRCCTAHGCKQLQRLISRRPQFSLTKTCRGVLCCRLQLDPQPDRIPALCCLRPFWASLVKTARDLAHGPPPISRRCSDECYGHNTRPFGLPSPRHNPKGCSAAPVATLGRVSIPTSILSGAPVLFGPPSL